MLVLIYVYFYDSWIIYLWTPLIQPILCVYVYIYLNHISVSASRTLKNGPRVTFCPDVLHNVVHRRSLPPLTAQCTCRLILRDHTRLFGCTGWNFDNPGLLDHACGRS